MKRKKLTQDVSQPCASSPRCLPEIDGWERESEKQIRRPQRARDLGDVTCETEPWR